MSEQAKVKPRRLRKIKQLPPLTKEEWDALPGRPHLWLDGKLVEMTCEQQANKGM